MRGSCVSVRLSSQFDAFCRARTWPLSLTKFDNSEVELRRVGGVNAPVGSRRELVANYTADALRHNSTVESRRRQWCVLCIRT